MKNNFLNKDAFEVISNLIEQEKTTNLKKMHELNVDEARKQYLKMREVLSPNPQDVYRVKNFNIEDIKSRYYRGNKNKNNKILPILLFFHGGGWVIGDLDTHDVICRQLANISDFEIISVGYGLGPENPFPKAIEDSIKILSWVSQTDQFPIDTNRIAVCGDSAGGNIATVLCIYNRDNLKKNILYQALIYPSTDIGGNYPSRKKYDGLILSKKLMDWFEKKYLNRNSDKNIYNDWRLAPIRSKSLKNLPPSLLLMAECDPLCDEGVAYAKRLKTEGNRVEQILFKGQIHGFITMGRKISDADKLISILSNRISRAFILN